ncbi:TPA: hypothetical protein ACX3A9_002819 [Vibrio parahaemolyticus]|uniref:hypothetical protein n=1 Tax=Vibrio parahaemolyticus TaxID=670 RepID=UPI001C5FD73A|nr:hypothetical protein [Vibrio parahaemolyticus]
MGISKEQEEKARKQFYEDIKDVDDADVEYASKKGNKKLDQLDSNPLARCLSFGMTSS